MKVLLKENENKVYEIYRVEKNAIVITENGELFRVANKEVLQVINEREIERENQSTYSQALHSSPSCP